MADDKLDGGVRSVQATLDILETLAQAEGEMGVTEIANRLGLTKATVFRHLATLVERGYLAQNSATSRYHLGSRLYLLGRLAPARLDLVSAAEEAMKMLRDEVGQTVVLSAASPKGALVLSTLTGKQPIEIGVRPGSELALHGAAQGKIVLAFGRPIIMERLASTRLQTLTEHTITSLPVLKREIGAVRSRGWATAPNEVLLGINALAAPILGPAGDLAGVLAIVGSVQFLGPKPTLAQLAALQRATRRIAQNLAPGPSRLGREPKPRSKQSKEKSHAHT